MARKLRKIKEENTVACTGKVKYERIVKRIKDENHLGVAFRT